MRQEAEIIDLDERRRSTQPNAPDIKIVTTASDRSETAGSAAFERGRSMLFDLGDQWAKGQRVLLAFDDLYPSDNQSLTQRIRQILLQNNGRLRSAREQDEIERDEAVNRLKIDLANIFGYKGLAAGQEMAIVALYHGLRNKRSAAISQDEYNEVIGTIRAMSERPRITIDTALDLVERLQHAGFNTDLEEASYLHELICD